MNLTSTGSCSFEFKVNDSDTGLTRADIDRLFTPNSRTLSLRWGDASVIGAWKIDDWDYEEDTDTLTVKGVEFRGEAKWRMTYGVNSYELGTLAIANRSASGAVRAILSRFMQWSAEWSYPIDLPADGAGTITTTWEYWKKLTIEDLLTQIEELGYEILFRPYLTAGRQLRYETLVAAKVSTGSSSFHLQAEKSPLGGIGYKVNGADQLTGGQGLGSGSGQDQPVAWSGSGPYLIPIRDAKRSFPDLTGAQLQSATNAWFAAARNPIVQWRVGSFTADDEFPAGLATVGRGWVLESSGHVVFPDGPHTLRVIACSGSFSNQISVEVQSAS
ncbi:MULTISPECIES: hypothetical protein [unclassified Microbacterium]|uniref:hypothetical protein n=1 Tax=unclassified Microbacterium TaxID=2609290 RepID=UPI0010F6EC27|nr:MULTISPECIES: hypothetical protein [unclassified Microbacterium]